MSATTINVYADGIVNEDETLAVLKQLLILTTESFTQINLKIQNMAKTLEDLSIKVDELEGTVVDVTAKNAVYVKSLVDAKDALTATNADLKAQLDAASQGGTVLDADKIQKISDQLDSIKSQIVPLDGGSPVVTPDPTPTPDPIPDPVPAPPVVDTTNSGDNAGTDVTPTPDPTSGDGSGTEIPASTDPNVKPW